MGAQTWKGHFTLQKVIFYFLFWGGHWGIFAYGWYETPSRASTLGCTMLTWTQVEAGG